MEKHFSFDESPTFRMLELDEVDSTNSYLRQLDMPDDRRMTLVTAEYQTGGRGAGTNRWESAKGENLLFSLRVMPSALPVARMFAISEATALAVRESLEGLLKEQGARGKEHENTDSLSTPPAPCSLPLAPTPAFTVKWPNDIYYGDSKVAGILIENDLMGSKVKSSVIGIGINVNQRRFVSDAPNPRSLADIVGHDVERRSVLEAFMDRIALSLKQIDEGKEEALDALHSNYRKHLYRFAEKHKYRDEMGVFCATLIDVEPSGHLVLMADDGKRRRYEFKEVKYIL